MAAVYQRNLLTGREGVCRRQNRFQGRGITPTNYSCLQGDGISRDPVGYDAGTNLYSYAGNNPINRVDPSGNDPVPPDVQQYIEDWQEAYGKDEVPWVGWWNTDSNRPINGWMDYPEHLLICPLRKPDIFI